jgi:tetratricopeptide (TPR) repeat protein
MQTLAVIAPDLDQTMRVDLASRTTTSLEALKSYLDGEVLHRAGLFREAAGAYERAVVADSMFALAWYGLASAWGWAEGVRSPRGREADSRAYALRDRLPDREAILVRGSREVGLGRPDALADLQRGVRMYPDDPEMWYQLGETYLHVPETLANWDDVTGAFNRAIELAPQFGPYRLHMIEFALRSQADSALATMHLEAFEAVNPSSSRGADWRLALDLVLGDSAHQAASMDQISGLSPEIKARLWQYAGHPRFWESRRPIMLQVSEQADGGFRWVQSSVAQLDVRNRGHLKGALDRLDQPDIRPGSRIGIRYALWLRGYPIPEDAFDDPLAGAAIETAGSGQALFVGSVAVDQGDEVLRAAAIERLLTIANEQEAEGDAIDAQRDRARAHALEGYGLWRDGDPEAARPILEEAQLQANDRNLRWWLFQLHRDAGRFVEAERYLQREMMWEPNPFAAYHLGQLYEEMEEPLKAREMYEIFVGNWTDPDLELQPWVDDATDRLLRLTDFQEPGESR